MVMITVELRTPEEWANVTGHDLDTALAELNVAQRRIEAAIVAATDHAEQTAHYEVDGHRTVTAWVMATTNCSHAEANQRRQTARALRDLPAVAAAFADGTVGITQVREIGRLAANPRAGDQVPGSEQLLLAAARSLEYADYRIVTRRWEQLADVDGAHADHEITHEHRNARCTTVGTEVRFETAHGVMQGEAMRSVFEAFCQAEFDRDRQWVKDTLGTSARADLLPRTAAQRRADAFRAMVLAAAHAGTDTATGTGRSIEPTINLICDLDQFEQRVANGIAGAPVTIDPATVRDRFCETTDGTPVDPRQLVAAAALGRLRLIVTDGAGVIVHAGRRRKLFTGALREAIQAIDPVCVWLGCNLRAQICDIDHLQPRSRGGPTDPVNAEVMCDRHNIYKHTAGYQVARQPDGTVTVARPDGTLLQVADAA